MVEINYISYIILFIVSFIYFLENFDRYILSVAVIPYINYYSYEYSLLSGIIFTLFYSIGAVCISIIDYINKNKTKHQKHENLSNSSSDDIRGSNAINSDIFSDSDTNNSQSKSNATNSNSNLFISLEHNENLHEIYNLIVSLTVACFVFSVSFTCTGIATNFMQQVFIRILMGVAQSIVTPYSIGIINIIFNNMCNHQQLNNKQDRISDKKINKNNSVLASALSIFNFGVYLAFSLSLSLGTWLYDEYGWSDVYISIGLLGVLFTFVIPCIYYLYKHNVKLTLMEELKKEQFESVGTCNQEEIYSGNSQPPISDSPVAVMSPLLKTNLETKEFNKNPLHNYSNTNINSHITQPIDRFNTPMERQCHHRDSYDYVNTTDFVINSNSIYSNSIESTVMMDENLDSDDGGATIDSDMKQSLMNVHINKENRNILSRVCSIVRYILNDCAHNALLPYSVLILATGIRIGGAFIWVAYTYLFYSEYTIENPDTDISFGDTCVFSYNASYTPSNTIEKNAYCTNSEYPYCMNGACNALSETPW